MPLWGPTPELSRPAAGRRLGASVAEKHPGGAPMWVRLERIVRRRSTQCRLHVLSQRLAALPAEAALMSRPRKIQKNTIQTKQAMRLQPAALGSKNPLFSRPNPGTPRLLIIHSGSMNAMRLMAETSGMSIRSAQTPVANVARIAALPRMLMKPSPPPNA